MGRVCNGPRVLWAEFVMGRDVPEPSVRVTSLINGDWSHIHRMRNGHILFNWRANIVVVNNILISPVNQNKWKTSDAKIWSEF